MFSLYYLPDQIHDFAEDGRPLAYSSESYPADCHYGVINRRDYQILLQSGLKQDGLHLMENTVTVPPPDIAQQHGIVNPMALYPIRAIRRKNIGEAILLSLFLKPGQAVVITLPPNSSADMKSYRGRNAFDYITSDGVIDFGLLDESSFLNLDEFSLLKWSDYTEEK